MAIWRQGRLGGFSSVKVVAFLLGLLLLPSCSKLPWGTAASPTFSAPTPTRLPPTIVSRITPASRFQPRTPTPNPTPTLPSPEQIAAETLQRLRQAKPAEVFHVVDFLRHLNPPLASQLPSPTPPSWALDDVRLFYILEYHSDQVHTIRARLLARTPHLYVWLDTRVPPDRNKAQQLAHVFETQIYPTNRKIFGPEPNPGVDNDPHLYAVFTPMTGAGIAGYFAYWDTLPARVRPYSNQHEMFVMNSRLPMDHPDTWRILAHEFQHMIHAAHDPTEYAWINEGLSSLAEWVNGYGASPWVSAFLQRPDIHLLYWPNPQRESTAPYYGGSFLFALYAYEHWGPAFIRRLVREPQDSLQGLQKTLDHFEPGRRAEDLLLDWAIALYLDEPSLAQGQFGYPNYQLPQKPVREALPCPGSYQGHVSPFGIDYLTLACPGTWEIQWDVSAYARLWPVEPLTGIFAFWSGYGHQSIATLTRAFDLSALAPGTPVTLKYRTWFDIEPFYDFGYVLLSADGQYWTIARTRWGSEGNPIGANLGWGYTGQSQGWVLDEVDLSAYAGGKVWVRFAYITDPAVNHIGWLIDEVEIPALGYRSNWEHSDDGWDARGFVRVANRIPRTYRLAIVTQGGAQPTVQQMTLTGQKPQTFRVRVPADGHVTMVLMDVTPFTREPALYLVRVQPLP
ncbi:MAG: hypothetical protein GXO36_06980 [Chloroflexi bacterium]|nr:hypothetical protein [Chloroflexota bacterium]